MTYTLKTGKEWSELLAIEIVNPTGWNKPEDFNNLKIQKTEFINRVMNSVYVPVKNKTRREINALKQQLKT